MPSTEGNRGCTDTHFLVLSKEGNRGCTDTSWCQARRETGCTDTSWCQARRETEAVQIPLGAKHRGKQRLYRYSLFGAKHSGKQRLYRYFLMLSKEGNRGCTDTHFLVPSKEGNRGCTDTHFLVPSKEPPMPAQPCTCVQPTGRICTSTNSTITHRQLLCPTGTPAAVRVDFISTSAKPVLVHTEKDAPLPSFISASQFKFRSL